MKSNRFRRWMALPILLVFLFGCCPICPVAPPTASQVPIPVAWPLSTQSKIQALHHWRLIAEDFACRMQEQMNGIVFENRQPVYIVPSGTTPFEKAFRELLITRFVEKGIPVSENPENSLPFSIRIQLIRHGKRMIRTNSGLYESLPPIHVRPDVFPEKIPEAERRIRASRLNVEAGRFTPVLPKNEILILASLVKGKEYLLRQSAIYYIDDAEWRHYRKSLAVHDDPAETVTYYLVDQ